MCTQNNGIAIFSFKRIYSSVKKPKKSQKAKYIFKASRLKVRTKKAKRPTKFFSPTNLKRGQIFEIWPKKANLATLCTTVLGLFSHLKF